MCSGKWLTYNGTISVDCSVMLIGSCFVRCHLLYHGFGSSHSFGYCVLCNVTVIVTLLPMLSVFFCALINLNMCCVFCLHFLVLAEDLLCA